MSDTIFNLRVLAGSDLVKADFTPGKLSGFRPAEWVPRMIELDLFSHREHNVYHGLAKVYGLAYVPDIAVPINPKDVVAYKVPTHLLIQSQLYPFEKDGMLYIASATPFVEYEVLHNILSFTGQAGYRLVITTPYQLREALKALYYIEFSTVAESRLRLTSKHLSASPPTILRYSRVLIATGLILALVGFVLPKGFLLGLFFAINILYIYLNGLKLATFLRPIVSPRQAAVRVSQQDIDQLSDQSLPHYTILVPLRFESNIVHSLTRRLASLDYPKSRLEVLFLVGVDDSKTIGALQQAGVDGDSASRGGQEFSYATIIRVPKLDVDTKPLVCNYGLQFATGDYTVIYDAEDKPEPLQLKKAVVGFQKSTIDTACLQSKLNFYNSDKNVLTRLFSLEYSVWYDYFLPGLQSLGSPVPLGGTSNHFVTNMLRRAGEWDPYNVTEDADLGLRLYRGNHLTRILDAYTYEESTSTVSAWLTQRSRWEKGYLATLIVHAQNPLRLYKELGAKKFLYGITIFFSNFYMPFINPLLWLITILWALNIFSLGELPAYIWVPAMFNLVVGNLTHLVMHVVAALRLKRPGLAPLTLLIPFYWVLISLATYRAGWELFTKPYIWNKTAHGANGNKRSTS